MQIDQEKKRKQIFNCRNERGDIIRDPTDNNDNEAICDNNSMKINRLDDTGIF